MSTFVQQTCSILLVGRIAESPLHARSARVHVYNHVDRLRLFDALSIRRLWPGRLVQGCAGMASQSDDATVALSPAPSAAHIPSPRTPRALTAAILRLYVAGSSHLACGMYTTQQQVMRRLGQAAPALTILVLVLLLSIERLVVACHLVGMVA